MKVGSAPCLTVRSLAMTFKRHTGSSQRAASRSCPNRRSNRGVNSRFSRIPMETSSCCRLREFHCRRSLSNTPVMPNIFEKLNLKEQREIVVLNAPDSFESALRTLHNVRILRRMEAVKDLSFALAFVTRQNELDKLSKAAAAKAAGDALLWFAYPKSSSKRYT